MKIKNRPGVLSSASGFFFFGGCNLQFVARNVISKVNEVTDKLNR